MSILNNFIIFKEFAQSIDEYTNLQIPNISFKKFYESNLKDFNDYFSMIEYLDENNKKENNIQEDFIKYNIDLIKIFEIKQVIYIQNLKDLKINYSDFSKSLLKINKLSEKLLDSFYMYMNKYYSFNIYKDLYNSLDKEEKESLISLINEKNNDEIINPYILLKEYNDLVFSFENDIHNIINNYLKDNNLTFAYQFEKILKKKDNENSIESLLNIEIFEDKNIKSKFSFTNNQDFKNIWLFNDNSILVKKNNDELEIVKNDIVFNNIFNKLPDNIISFSLRKNPHLAKIFHKKLLELKYNNDVVSLLETMQSVLDNHQILKNINFNFNEINNKSIEAFSDLIDSSIRRYKIENYRKSIISNKYIDYLDEYNYKLFESLYDEKVSKEDLQKYIGKKLASCKNKEMFNESIKTLINIINSFEINIITNKLKKDDINIFYNKDNVIAFEVKEYQQSKKYGSQSWCIQRSESTFENYISNSKQIFVYDFNKEVHDNKSMFGITIYNNGNINTQHFKDDKFFELLDYKLGKEIYIEALNKILNKNQLTEENLKYLDNSKNLNKLSNTNKMETI